MEVKGRSQIVFRVDGGKHLGMGHLFKMRILMDALKKERPYFNFQVFIRQDPQGINWLKETGIKYTKIPQGILRAREAHWMIRKMQGSPENSVYILDILNVSKPYVTYLKKVGAKVITLENQSLSQEVADITVNAIVDGVQTKVRSRKGNLIAKGADFRIFHPDYKRVKKSVAPQRKKKNVLISLGGGEDKGLCRHLIQQMGELNQRVDLDVVIGPAQKLPQIKKVSQKVKVNIHQGVKSLAPLLRKSSVGILAGGGTLYEAAFMGVPTIAFSKKPHQIRNIRYFQKAGTALYAGGSSRQSASRGVQLLGSLLNETKRCQKMTGAAKKLVDGRGAMRVRNLILKLADNKVPTWKR